MKNATAEDLIQFARFFKIVKNYLNMRKYITILFILGSFGATAQQYTSGGKVWHSLDSIVFDKQIHLKDLIPIDTIPAILLVCDTSAYAGFKTTVHYLDPILKAAQDGQYLYWLRGFEIVEKLAMPIGYAGDFNRGEPVIVNRHISYLIENKKPLPKNIIVWMAK